MKTDEVLVSEWIQMKKWIRQTVLEAGFKRVILGLSGGFDSGFLAFTAAQEDCLGKENVVGVLMSCNSSVDSLRDAIELGEKLGIRYFVDNLNRSVNIRSNEIKEMRRELFSCGWDIAKEEMSSTELGNVKARMRMLTLYGYAPAFNALVMNTSNYSESMSGNGTKFGDMAGDFGPLLNYTKTSLYKMAKAVGFDEVAPEIFNKTPTADLEPNQTDEGTMGVSYSDLDTLLDDEEKDLEQIVVKRICRLIKISRHKREEMPKFFPSKG